MENETMVRKVEEASVVQGTGADAAFAASGGGGPIGFKSGLLFSDYQGDHPLSTDGTILQTTGAATVAKGIDWSSYTFTGNQFTGVGFTISSAGSPTFLQYNVAGSSNGLISINPQAAAGTYNFNLPTSAGTSGQPLLSGGGSGAAMTWGSMSTNTLIYAGTSFAYVNSGQTRYYSIGSGSQDATEVNASMPAGQAMTLKNLYVAVSAAPGAGNSWTYMLRKIGADTAITCTISDAATSASDLTDTVSYTATDLLDIRVVASATVTASVTHKMALTGVTTPP